MGSNDEPAPSDLKLPFIDFSEPLLSATDDDHGLINPAAGYWDSLKSQVREALEEYGCFEASIFNEAAAGDDDDQMMIQSRVYSSLKEVFDLPLSTKRRRTFAASETTFRGYLGQHPEYPLTFESFGIDDPDLGDEIDNFTNTLWEDDGRRGNSSFSKNIQSLLEKASKLDRIVRRMIVESFGLEKYMNEHMNSTTYHLRIMKYDASQTHDSKLGLRSHTDKNIITILCQSEVEGLEVQTRKGEWIRFRAASPGSFIVLAGDSLHAWLNGRAYNPYHRVMVSGKEPRYSFGLFTVPKAEYIIKAPEELIEEQHPLLFKPFAMKEYFGLAYTPAGRKEAAPLQTYYGL